MKKIMLAFSLVMMTIPTVVAASWGQTLGAVAGAAAGILTGIHDYQCKRIAEDIDYLLEDIIYEMPYVARKFAYEDESLVYNIEDVLRGIRYEWFSFIEYHARTCFVTATHLRALNNVLHNLFEALRYCRPVASRCYEYELRDVDRILCDVEDMMRAPGYEAMREGQCGFLWNMTRAVERVTSTIRRI